MRGQVPGITPSGSTLTRLPHGNRVFGRKASAIARVRAGDEMDVARIALTPGRLLSISREIWNGQVRSFRLSYAEMSIASRSSMTAAP